MATAEQFMQAAQTAQIEQQIGWRDGQTEEVVRWRLAYDALVDDVRALRAEVAEVRADLDALRADLATAD